MLTFRKATANDIAQLTTVEQKVIEAERPFNNAIQEGNPTYYDMEHLLMDKNTLLLVAEEASKIIASGYVQIRSSKPFLKHTHHGYLGLMFVATDYRGRGLNQLIMKKLIAWAKARQIRDFYLDVYAHNLSAIKAYEKVGFCSNMIEMKLSIPTANELENNDND
ncbi:GNAT family N-acetyltransferase [Alteromonas ponticola]|uniref:GNAT family N-acetyltransferase n=1 Tax=Alteromonas aquimaris TaxID=2998417 RepID=A0ABT3PAE4_9ALTE|nr:GNAT family N-acetyltransferase [Alteromonas aquimaris]MCW8109728.1 GNAT family N-acetyltransferase [Alteromonas aquimaris]